MSFNHYYLISVGLIACALVFGLSLNALSSAAVNSTKSISGDGGMSVTTMTNSGSGYNRTTVNGKKFELKNGVLTYENRSVPVPAGGVVKIVDTSNRLQIFVNGKLIVEELK
jgi:hypothetical protein